MDADAASIVVQGLELSMTSTNLAPKWARSNCPHCPAQPHSPAQPSRPYLIQRPPEHPILLALLPCHPAQPGSTPLSCPALKPLPSTTSCTFIQRPYCPTIQTLPAMPDQAPCPCYPYHPAPLSCPAPSSVPDPAPASTSHTLRQSAFRWPVAQPPLLSPPLLPPPLAAAVLRPWPARHAPPPAPPGECGKKSVKHKCLIKVLRHPDARGRGQDSV